MFVFIFLSFLFHIRYAGDDCSCNLSFGLQEIDLRLGLEEKKHYSKMVTVMEAPDGWAHHSGTDLGKVGKYSVVLI